MLNQFLNLLSVTKTAGQSLYRIAEGPSQVPLIAGSAPTPQDALPTSTQTAGEAVIMASNASDNLVSILSALTPASLAGYARLVFALGVMVIIRNKKLGDRPGPGRQRNFTKDAEFRGKYHLRFLHQADISALIGRDKLDKNNITSDKNYYKKYKLSPGILPFRGVLASIVSPPGMQSLSRIFD